MDRSPADPAVQVWIEQSYANLNKQFFTCSPEVYRSIGDGYVTDERTREYYETIKSGMAQFMRDAIHAYCDKLEGK